MSNDKPLYKCGKHTRKCLGRFRFLFYFYFPYFGGYKMIVAISAFRASLVIDLSPHRQRLLLEQVLIIQLKRRTELRKDC